MTAPRPTTLTREMRARIGEKLAARLARAGHILADEANQCAADIAVHGARHEDGYALAKRLDRMCGWRCRLDMAEALDDFGSLARREISAAVREWVTQEGITATLLPGQRGLYRGKPGSVVSIYDRSAAEYVFRHDDATAQGLPPDAALIANFEDVTPLVEEALP